MFRTVPASPRALLCAASSLGSEKLQLSGPQAGRGCRVSSSARGGAEGRSRWLIVYSVTVTQEYSRQPVSVPVLSLQRVHWSPSSCLQSRNLSPLAKTTRFCPPYTAIASSVSPELVSDPSPQLRVSAPPLLPSALRLHPLPASNPRH